MDNKDYIGVLLDSCYTTITGWGVLLIYVASRLTSLRFSSEVRLDGLAAPAQKDGILTALVKLGFSGICLDAPCCAMLLPDAPEP